MKILNLTIAALVFATLIAGAEAQQATRGKVLIDAYHVAPSEAFDENAQFLTLRLQSEGYAAEQRSEPLSYSLLKDYNVLVVITPTSSFSGGEVATIMQFVQEGGGLLLVGESRNYSIATADNKTILFSADVLNPLSNKFNITFNRDTLAEKRGGEVKQDITVNLFEKHALMSNVTRLQVLGASTLTISGKAKKIAWGGENVYSETYEVVSYPPLIAALSYGYGKALALTDTQGYFRADDDTKKFLSNALDWLNVKPRLAQANGYLANGNQLLAGGDYANAKTALASALSIFAALEIEEKISEASSLAAKGDKGINADSLMQSGASLLGEKRYADAKSAFDEANRLYKELGNAAKEQESQKMINLASQSLTGSALFEDAMKSFNQGEYAKAKELFAEAKKKFEESRGSENAARAEEMIQKSEQGIAALGTMSGAENLIKNKEFEKAKSTLAQAKNTFTALGSAAKAQEAQKLIERAEKYAAAYSKLDEAKKSFETGDYENAKNLYSEAKSLFIELEDDAAAKEADAGVRKSEESLKKKSEIGTTIIAAIAVLLILVGIYVVWSKRQKKAEEAPVEKAAPESAKIMEIEEDIKKLNMRYTQGGISKKDYGRMLHELEEKLETEKRKIAR